MKATPLDTSLAVNATARIAKQALTTAGLLRIAKDNRKISQRLMLRAVELLTDAVDISRAQASNAGDEEQYEALRDITIDLRSVKQAIEAL